MKKLLRENSGFLLVYTIFLLLVGYLVLFKEKSAIHLAINSFHNPFLDQLFAKATWLGSGWAILVILIIFLFIKYRYIFILLISNLFITLTVQGMKHLAFPGTPRPVEWFKEISQLYLVPGIKIHHFNSFPSGHAATAFGLFFILCLITRNSIVKLLWFFLALLTAFSRVYLSQHFLIDIMAGSFIGIFFTFFSFYYFNKFVGGQFDGSLIKEKP